MRTVLSSIDPTRESPPQQFGISQSMCSIARLTMTLLMATTLAAPLYAQDQDDFSDLDASLKIFAVHVVKTTPFQKPFTGYGVYLGHGAVITAAHVIGRFGFLKNPRVLIAGQDLSAKVVKEGSLAGTDLTLLSVDEATVPMSFRLRRNPLCKRSPPVGEDVVIAVPERTTHAQIVSPDQILPRYRKRFNALISQVAGSGSGVFDAAKGCLLGIVSRKIAKFNYRKVYGRWLIVRDGEAGYFVPASEIAAFIPEEYRF